MAGQIGALRVVLGANTAGFEQGMRRAAQTARRTGQDIERSYLRVTQSGVRAFSTLRIGAISLATALAGSALARYGRDALTWASGLSETAQQIGVTVEQLQILRLAAEQNGASVEGMERAVSILNRTLGQAQGGSRAAIEAFRQIGISKEQIDSFRNVGDAIPVVNEGISRLRTGMQQTAAAQTLYGRGSRELLVLIQQGRAGWDAATQAAIRNGLVTEEQARKADEAADALTALGSALRVQVLGAIVDALPGLIQIVNVLGQIISFAIRAIGFIGQIFAAFTRNRPSREELRDNILARQGRAPWQQEGARAIGGALIGMGLRAPRPSGRNLNLGGRTGGAGGRTQTDDGARRAHEFDKEQRQLQIENLRALMESTEALDRRNEIQSQIVTLENEQWLADLRYRQSQGEITETQANRLIALKNILLATEAITRATEYNRRVAEQENDRAVQQEGYAQDRLRAEADMAETMAERRRIEFDLLRITIENRRRALQQQIEIANARGDGHAASTAQLELDNLGNVEARERRRIMRDTRGPLQNFLAELPLTAAKLNEALENVAANGLNAISDGLLDVITGAESMGKVFKRVANQIIADLLRIQIQRDILGPLANALAGVFAGGGVASLGNRGVQGLLTSLPGRAAGGPVLPGRTYVVGEKGPELLQMGGAGGYVVANDNIGGGQSITVNQTFEFRGVAVTQDEFMQGLLATKDATMRAIHQANRRRG